jgi:SAM-dependent methyltransferase
MAESLQREYFEQLYDSDPDPWRFRSSDYERDKYKATLAALPRERVDDAFEVGCSVGVLTAQLASRCDRLLAVDVAEAALRQAREACAGLPNVRFARMQIPADWPDGPFDLILLSEVLYYLSLEDVRRTARKTGASLTPGGAALLVHWTGLTNYPLSADAAVAAFVEASGLRPASAARTAEYRLDLLIR